MTVSRLSRFFFKTAQPIVSKTGSFTNGITYTTDIQLNINLAFCSWIVGHGSIYDERYTFNDTDSTNKHVKGKSMLRTYFKTAWRFLLKNKTFSFINVFGLAVGTLCCLYILVYVKDQYSYDKHHTDVNRIYRVDKKVKTPDGSL